MLKDQKRRTEVKIDGKKRKVEIKIMLEREEEKEKMKRLEARIDTVKEKREMVNMTEVMTGEKRKVTRTDTRKGEEIKKGKREEKQTDMKEVETEIPEKKKRPRTGRETRSENDGKKKTETDWIKKIKILTKVNEGEVIDTTRKIKIRIEGRSTQKMRQVSVQPNV